jgi:antitoxin (DNA-binding transcriptional repressor) of toxin-antitoxin stability system
MYQVALTNEQTQLNFLVKQVLQGEEVIITDENGFHFKLISLLPQKINKEKPKTKLSEHLLAPEIAIPDNLFERNQELIRDIEL